MTKVRFAKALGTLLLSFAAAYGPAFLTVALLKLRPFEAVPVIIVISLAVAILLIDALTTLVNHLSSGPPPPEMLFRP